MPSDVNRLFSMIKQDGLPYQVFDEEAAALPATEVERKDLRAIATDQPANEYAAPAHAGLFRAYTAVAASPPPGLPLADIFRRMSTRLRAVD